MPLLVSAILESLLLVVVILVFTGMGGLGASLLLGRGEWRGIGGPVDTFWLGLPVAVAAVHLVHFLGPIATPARVLACVAAACGWLLLLCRWQKLRPQGEPASRFSWIALGFCLVGIVSVCHRIKMADTGLYYEQTILWAQARSIMPGLANLHERLAFNGSSLLLESLLGPMLPVGRRFSAVAGATYWVLAYMAARGLIQVAKGKATTSSAMLAWCLPFLLFQKQLTRSAAPDIVLWVVQVAAGYYLIRATEARESATRAFSATVSGLLLATAVTVKLSSVVFSVCTLVGLAWYWKTRQRVMDDGAVPWPRSPYLRPAVAGAALGALVLCTWVGRNVVLSGELLFPVPATTVPVPWALPKDVALTGQYRDIRAWARAPGGDSVERASQGAWLLPWARLTANDPLVMSSLVCLGVSVLLLTAAPVVMEARPVLLILTSAAVVTGLFISVTAPDFRFAGGALVAGHAPLAALLLGDPAGRRKAWGVTTLAGSLVCAVLLLANFRSALAALSSGADRQEYPIAEVRPVPLVSGLVVNVPLDSERCWNAALPCAPEVSPHLRAAGPVSDLASIRYFYMQGVTGPGQ